MALFGGDSEENTEEVKLGLMDEESEKDTETGSSESSSGSELESDVKKSMGLETGEKASNDKITLKDIHEQNKEIKNKLDTLISEGY